MHTEGYTFEEFGNDSKTVDATVFIISQIGELVKNISKETMEKYSNYKDYTEEDVYFLAQTMYTEEGVFFR